MTVWDRFLATADERRDAAERAAEALRNHGADAEAHLVAKLADPRRRRSRRPIRLALDVIRAQRQALALD